MSILLRNGTILIHEADDTVKPLKNTDLLIENHLIAKIGPKLTAPSGAEIIDCTNKIISPGFIDTHHHLWSTQLKGRHDEHQLLDYMVCGNLTSYAYQPEDTFWGQLAGSLEAIDAGTTTVLDHNHGLYTDKHANEALKASISSGLRTILAYSIIFRLSQWTQTEITPNSELLPEQAFRQIEEFCIRQHQPDNSNSLVQIGFGFDLFFLPRDVVVRIFQRVRAAGVRRITCHACKNAVFGTSSLVELLESYGLLGPDIVISHLNETSDAEKTTLADAGVYVSSTPDTESHMGMGWPVALDGALRGHASLGVDIHSSNSASIPGAMRALLALARAQSSQALLAKGQYPANVRASAMQAFNLGTICGARALGLDDVTGSIVEGKKADLVVLDAGSPSMVCAAEFDPVVAVVRHSDVRDVEVVIVDGVVRKREGMLVDVVVDGRTMTWNEVAEQLRRSREDVQGRIDQLNLAKAKELLIEMWHIDMDKLVRV